MTVLNEAFLSVLSFKFLRTRLMFSSELQFSPAYLADFTPGSPPRESIKRPVSSEKQSILYLLYMKLAFSSALPWIVFSVSAISYEKFKSSKETIL